MAMAIRIRIRIATLVRRALAEVCTVQVLVIDRPFVLKLHYFDLLWTYGGFVEMFVDFLWICFVLIV